jgi:hypothetical protein
MKRTGNPAGRLACVLALALGAVLLVSCAGPAPAAYRTTARATPANQHGIPKLAWRPGERIEATGQVQQKEVGETADRAVQVSLTVRPTQSIRVTAVQGGEAALRVETTGWKWLEDRSELIIPRSPPAPFQVQVDPRGVLRVGELWSLPNHPRPPGIDLLSAGLPDHHVERADRWVAQWRRTKRDDLPLDYRVASVVSAVTPDTLTVDSHLAWDVGQISNTSTGDVERLEGTGQGDVRSRFDTARGRLQQTSYTVTYDTTDTTAGSVVRTHGTFAADLTLTYP